MLHDLFEIRRGIHSLNRGFDFWPHAFDHLFIVMVDSFFKLIPVRSLVEFFTRDNFLEHVDKLDTVQQAVVIPLSTMRWESVRRVPCECYSTSSRVPGYWFPVEVWFVWEPGF